MTFVLLPVIMQNLNEMESEMIKKMMTVLFLMLMSLMAYAASSENITSEYSMPTEMKGCKIFYLKGGGWSHSDIYVTHCPNAVTDTSFKSGKTEQHVVSGSRSIIDDSVSESEADTVEINGSKYVKVPD